MNILRITSYGGYAIRGVTGFEQVVANGIPTYYVLNGSVVAQFDQYWNYGKFYSLSYNNYNLKYVNGYFYISAGAYFYKTDMNFNRIASYYKYNFNYKSIYYDSSSSLFYVAGSSQSVSIYDTNCNFQRFMTLGGYYSPGNALSFFNGNLYFDYGTSIAEASKATGAVVAKYDNVCYYYPSGINSITFDSFGYMAVSCYGNSIVALYNAINGTYLTSLAEISSSSFFTAVDGSGRFVSVSYTAIDIFY